MNLFKTLAGVLKENADITIVVRKGADDKLTASVSFRNNNVNDPARDVIAPFVVSGTPEEMDAEFAGLIAQPLEQSAGIQTSMENFEASKKAAQAKSQAAAEAKKKEAEEKKAAQGKVDKAIAEAKKLILEKKWAEAKTVLETARSENPGVRSTDIAKMLDTCAKNETPDIFSFGNEEEPEEPEMTGTDEPETEETEEE